MEYWESSDAWNLVEYWESSYHSNIGQLQGRHLAKSVNLRTTPKVG